LSVGVCVGVMRKGSQNRRKETRRRHAPSTLAMHRLHASYHSHNTSNHSHTYNTDKDSLVQALGEVVV